jgi:hypothetical protein
METALRIFTTLLSLLLSLEQFFREMLFFCEDFATAGELESVNARSVLCVVGTRPEAIKMAPVVHALRRRSGMSVRLLLTGQHRDLLDQALARRP